MRRRRMHEDDIRATELANMIKAHNSYQVISSLFSLGRPCDNVDVRFLRALTRGGNSRLLYQHSMIDLSLASWR